eukprot:scaffold532_cov275-Chaetoceros_neogracile.AAC.5
MRLSARLVKITEYSLNSPKSCFGTTSYRIFFSFPAVENNLTALLVEAELKILRVVALFADCEATVRSIVN